MEIYILDKQDLSILSICKPSDYELNLDEETNAKSTVVLKKTEGLKDGNFIVLNGLYKQFLFVIPRDGVQTTKGSNIVTVSMLDISNIFDQKVISKNLSTMTSTGLEDFIANTILNNFVNSDDVILNINYIETHIHSHTLRAEPTNEEDGLYNLHTFITNCRQNKNIYTEFSFTDGKLRIDIENKTEDTELIDTTVNEVSDYNKVYEADITAKVTAYIREDGTEYNLYLKTDKTTTENKNDVNRVAGKTEVISVENLEKAREEALNIMKGNRYNHLVEFKIAKTSKLMDVTQLHIGRPVMIKTTEDIYESYISAITIKDENFIYYKSGSLRVTLLDKLKKTNGKSTGNKLDISGGVINGDLTINGNLENERLDNIDNAKADNSRFSANCTDDVDANDYTLSGMYYLGVRCANMPFGESYVRIIVNGNDGRDISQEATAIITNRKYTRTRANGTWAAWREEIQWLGAIHIDLNSVAQNCDFYADSGSTNRPSGVGNGYVSVRVANSNYITQTYEPVSTPANVFYKRQKIAGTWTAWVTYHSA